MTFRYLDKDGALSFWTNIKNFILSKIPTKTSELTNDSGFLTQHQSLSNYVTLNSEQTITGKKLFTNSTTQVNSVNTFTGSTLFIDTSASAPRGSFPESAYRVGRIYIGDGTSYNGAWFIIDPTIETNKAYYRMVTTNPDNTDSTRFTIEWNGTLEGARRRRNISMGDLLPSGNNMYNLGSSDLKWDIGYIHNLIGSNKENASEDANNYYSTTSGSHMTFYTTTNGGTKLSNVPAAVNTQLESRTIRYLSASDWNVEQICHNTSGLYYRKGNNNGWGDWKTFAFTDSNITGTASNVTGTVAIANGGTGATTRLNAIKNLTNESVGSPTHFLGLTTNYAKCGYTSIAQAKTVLGITGDIVTHNASEFLTSHQSLSSCVKNVVTNNQTIKSTAITRGTAPSSAQTFGIAFSDNNDKYIGNVYGQYATNKSTYVGLYAYKGTTTSNSDNTSVRVGYDASGNAYTYAPTPATTDNSTQIATTAFVKAQGYLTSHQSLANYVTTNTDQSISGIKSHSKHISILGDYIGNEFSTNARTCLYLKSNRDTDGKSGIYFSKFRQNVAQGALTGSNLVSLTLDVLENSVRTNNCISIDFRYFENDVPTKIYVIPKKSATSYMGTSDNPWTNAYITNLNLNGNAFDPTSIDGIGTTRLLAYEPTHSTEYTLDAGTTKPGSSLYDVSMELCNATGYYGIFDSGSGEFRVNVNARKNQSGTWKVLHDISVNAPQDGARSFAIAMWVRIA